MRVASRTALIILLASAGTGCGGTDQVAAPAVTTAATGAVAAVSTTRPAPVTARPAPAAKRPAAPAATSSAPARPARCRAGSTRPVGSKKVAYAAIVRKRAAAYRSPSGARLASFGRKNVNGVPTVFSVLEERLGASCKAAWYRVQLPLKPNGLTGWVRAADVDLAPVETRILVDLSERKVTLFERGKPVLSAPVAIGSRNTPTPTGRYYVNQRLVPTNPSGPFGPGAIGISAFSEVLTGWTQGGPIAIHGTNRPSLIGRAVSNGCIRVRNDLLKRLFARTLAGTPVTVRA